MSVTTIPIEIFELLEDKLGREDAKKVAESINLSLDTIENRANVVVLQKKVEIKEELTKELATKADLIIVKKELEGEIKAVQKELEGKATRADIKELEGKINNLEEKMNSLELRLTVKLGAVVAAGIAVVTALDKLL